MRDYAELVKAWQYCTVSKTCDGCPMQKNCPEISHQIVAADAIEELLAAVPKWISMEERLPDEWREVLTYSPIHSDEKNPHMIQLCWYIGNGKWRECQYGEIVEIPITHWMPLPKAPKEVQDD